MKQITYDYVLIGSGPSALAALLKLPKDKEVLVIDRGIQVPEEIKEMHKHFRECHISHSPSPSKSTRRNSKTLTRLDLKMYWGSDFAYKLSNEVPPYESQSQGGFTNVWGATCFPASLRTTSKLVEKTKIQYQRTTSELEQIIDVAWSEHSANCYSPCSSSNTFFKTRNSFFPRFGHSGSFTNSLGTLFWEQTRLAISISNQIDTMGKQYGCTNCGLCQEGCPFDLTWNSWSTLRKEIYKKHYDYIVGDVTLIQDLDASITVHFSQGAQKRSVRAKRLLLTGGVLSNEHLLLNSGFIKQGKIHDSQTIAFLGFSLSGRRIQQHFDKVSFPELSFLYQAKDREAAIQLYSLNQSIATRVSPLFANLIFSIKPINWAMRRFFFVGLAYFDSEISGSLYFNKTNRLVLDSNIRQIRKMYGQIKKILRKKSLYLLPFKKFFNVGGGYHFMGNYFPDDVWSDDQHLLDQGMMKLTPLASFSLNSRIHILGGSIQGFLPTGSVTLNSMTITSIVVSRIVDYDSISDSTNQLC